MNPQTTHPSPRRPARSTPAWQTIGSLLVLAIAAILLFARLGHYALWDDEAGTALIGEGVWKTGDTSVVIGHNIMAFRNGAELTGLKARYLPPLQHYVDAPFVGLWPGSALAARLPFAVLGFLTVALVLWWMWRDRAGRTLWILLAMGIVGNVSFWLYCRQARYYSLTMFLSVAIVYLYLHFYNRRWVPAAIGLLSATLIASSYLAYAALYGAIGVDWLIWGRKEIRPGWRGWLWIWIPQLVLGAPIVWVWNPLAKSVVAADQGNAIANRLRLFWWFLRDMNRCEFGVMILIAAAPLLWLWRRDAWLLRAPLALLCYVVMAALTSPQKTWIKLDGQWGWGTYTADVRYLCPIILLAVAIGALAIRAIVPKSAWWLAIPLGAIAFFTNALNGGSLFAAGPSPETEPAVRSTLVQYVGELIAPPPDPYSAAADWVNAHVKYGQEIVVLPEFMQYPLMYHAPQAVYAWQLSADKRSRYPTLPAIDFKFNGAPDYAIVFGRGAPPLRMLPLPNGRTYMLVKTINVFAKCEFKPELFLHTFAPILDFDPTVNGIRIYKLVGHGIVWP